MVLGGLYLQRALSKALAVRTSLTCSGVARCVYASADMLKMQHTRLRHEPHRVAFGMVVVPTRIPTGYLLLTTD